ncbi:FMN-binding protein MioC [Agaribacter flavus]|uniref:FMN-binding protein MioC n=1 Tax=Agaribacter flavus TaxID=1902781 RepID=A0ABV7FU69_9ALTE
MMDIHIVVGSVLGASEYVADALNEYLSNKGHQCTLHFQPIFTEVDFSKLVIIITSTHGAGELPDNIQDFADELINAQLDNTNYLLIGLGDTSYDTFCNGARTIENLMKEANARLLHPALHIDVLQHPVPEEFALEWFEQIVDKL